MPNMFAIGLALALAGPAARTYSGPTEVDPTVDGAPSPNEVEPEPVAGPKLDLAPEHAPATPEPEPRVKVGIFPGSSEDPFMRGLAPERRAARNTVIGGYGQLEVTSLRVGPAATNDFDTTVNLRRLVVFLAHDLTDKIEIYTELEWENAIACQTCRGSVEIEQAILDWKLYREAIVFRSGLVLVPMGIVNQWHEPPTFHGTERPRFDQTVIPSTWRELGLGFTGRLGKYVGYELYLMTPLIPEEMGPQGLVASRTLGSLTRANSVAGTGRIEVEPLLGVIAGGSFYISDVGRNGEFYNSTGDRLKLKVPLFGYSLDVRAKKYGLEARAVWAQFFMPKAGDIVRAYREDGSPWFPNVDTTGPIPMRIEGGYVEAGYDILWPIGLLASAKGRRIDHQLVPFVRAELYDTQAAVPDGYRRNRFFDVQELTMGVSYRPIPNLVFKVDAQLRDRKRGLDELQINGGTGYMF